MSTSPAIVCAVDLSDDSRVGLTEAVAWADRVQAPLIVVTVIEPLLVTAAAIEYGVDLRDEIYPELRRFIDTTLKDGPDVPVTDGIVLVGEPATEIVGLARREHAGLIVMARHGVGEHHRMFLQSTIEKVLRRSDVPVLVAQPHD